MKKLSILALGIVAAGAQAQITISASTAAFVDISGTGTSIGSISDDSETTITGATLTSAGWAGNDLLAANVSIRIGNNGGILWGNSSADTFTSATEVGAINSTTFMTMVGGNSSFGSPTGNGGLGPRQFLAVLWDDNTPGAGGNIKWQMVGADLVVQWTAEDHFNATGATVTYEAIMHGGVTIASGNSLVDFVYNDTFYAASQYQNDGGSATIGYKNWAINASANDVEWGTGGGNNTLSDPTFGGANMQPKVGGYLESGDPALTHAVKIQGVPEPGTMAALGLGALAMIRKRRRK